MSITIPDPPGTGGVVVSSKEIEIQRNLTRAFIDTQPVVLYLVPREKVKKPSGGFSWEEGAARSAQTLRLIEQGNIPIPSVTLDGVERRVEFELLGEWDAEIGEFDIFQLDGKDWEVVQVAYFNGWEQRALVSRIG